MRLRPSPYHWSRSCWDPIWFSWPPLSTGQYVFTQSVDPIFGTCTGNIKEKIIIKCPKKWFIFNNIFFSISCAQKAKSYQTKCIQKQKWSRQKSKMAKRTQPWLRPQFQLSQPCSTVVMVLCLRQFCNKSMQFLNILRVKAEMLIEKVWSDFEWCGLNNDLQWTEITI